MLLDLQRIVSSGAALTRAQVQSAVGELSDETCSPEAKADFLTALAIRGETLEEIQHFAEALRGLSIVPPIDPALRNREILDVCGTGGDRLNLFNLSTTVAILVSSAGVPVAKHGNRAITSQSGSADVLEELGIRIDLSPEEAAVWLSARKFAFFFAPRYHPAFKHIAPARKLCAERGQRTLFNFLGPLLNPARPSAQLLGLPNPALCEPIARVLQGLGLRRAMVVCGEAEGQPMDELSICGGNTIAEFYQERGFNSSRLEPEEVGLARAPVEALKGGGKVANAAIARAILEGSERGPRRDATLLNAGAALFTAAAARSLIEGVEMAAELIDGGKAGAQLAALAKA